LVADCGDLVPAELREAASALAWGSGFAVITAIRHRVHRAVDGEHDDDVDTAAAPTLVGVP
jgi:hypothetical protein